MQSTFYFYLGRDFFVCLFVYKVGWCVVGFGSPSHANDLAGQNICSGPSGALETQLCWGSYQSRV